MGDPGTGVARKVAPTKPLAAGGVVETLCFCETELDEGARGATTPAAAHLVGAGFGVELRLRARAS